MIDYPAARAVAAVVQTGSFERAATLLNVTPSAVSQRVRHLEDRLGTVLIERGVPCTATDKGAWLCRHMDRVGLLEKDLMAQLPELAGRESPSHHVTLNIAANADSVGTWFVAALAAFTRESGHLVSVAIDDEEHTADWLRRGRVIAAVTALDRPVQGCRVMSLGRFRYRATASPAYMARYFPDGVTAAAIARAPGLTFNRKDRLQQNWIRAALGVDVPYPTHWLPSTQSFVDACLAGMGWALNPGLLVDRHLADGSLVELIPGVPHDRPLFWQVSRLAAGQLGALTRIVTGAAREAFGAGSPQGDPAA